MRGKVQEKNVKLGWREALADARGKLAEGRKYVSRMRSAIRIIEGKIADGEEFPGINVRKSQKYLDTC
jgi:hypothetical protein